MNLFLKTHWNLWLKVWSIYFFVGLALRLGFASSSVYLDSSFAPLLGDSWILHSMARNFLELGTLSYCDIEPTLYQLPFYPLFMAGIYQLWGAMDARMVLVVQLLFISGIIPVIVLVLRPILGRATHILGFWLLLDSHLLIYSLCLLSEFLVFIFWTLSWLCFYLYTKKEKKVWIYVCFILWALAAWSKPLTVYFAPLCVLGLFLCSPRFSWARRKELLLGLCLYGILLQPLLYRNYLLTAEYPRYSTISSFGMYYFNIPFFDAKQSGASGADWKIIQDARTKRINDMAQDLREQGRDVKDLDSQTANDRNKHRTALGLNEYEHAKLCDKLSARALKGHLFDYSKAHLSCFPSVFFMHAGEFKLLFNRFDAISFSGNSASQLFGLLKKGDFKSLLLSLRIYELLMGSLLVLSMPLALILGAKKEKKAWPFILVSLFFMVYVAGVSGINTYARFKFLFIPQGLFLILFCLSRIYAYFKKTAPDA